MLDMWIQPMEPVPHPRPFDSEDYIFQVKWDGVRILAFIGERIRLQSKKLKDKTEKYPELHQLKDLIKAREAVLDGEVVVIHKGKPSFPEVIRRDFSSDMGKIKSLTAAIPVDYIIFDILYLNGMDLTGMPLYRRQEILAEVLIEKGPVHIIENFDKGKDLFNAVSEQGLEGIVAKIKDSPYLFGKSNYWKKVKCRRSQLCVAGGYVLKDGRPVSILLGAFREDRLLYIGRASAGMKEKDFAILRDFTTDLIIPEPPFLNPPHIKGETYVWLKPLLTVKVEYAEWTEDMKLRAPSLKGFCRIDPRQCSI